MLSALTLGLQMGLTTAMPMPAALVSIERHSQFELDRYTRQIEADGGWWVELENRLLVVAPPTRLPDLLAGTKVEQDLGWVRPEDFALQSRACGVEHGPPLPVLAEAGRFALVRTPATTLPYAAPEISEWRPLVPNTMLARDLKARGWMRMAKGTPDPDIQLRVNAVNTPRWFAALSSLATFDRSSYGTGANPGIDQARDWLIGQFGALGLGVSTQSVIFNSTQGVIQVDNVIARRTGTLYPDEWVVVGGHYDSRQQTSTNPVQTPGAEDNASGCAGVLEAARVFTQFPPQRTMIFVCFAGEEQGLHGGSAYAQSLQNSGDLAKVDLAVIMDMIGYSGDADLDVLLESSSALSAVFTPFLSKAATYAPELRLVQDTSPCCSDHMPFIQRGTPALLTIENDYNSYAWYHNTQDLPANISNAEAMGGGILRMNIAVLADAAGMDAIALFGDSFE